MKILFSFLFLLRLTAFAKYEATTTVQVYPSVIAFIQDGKSPKADPTTLLTRNYVENEFETIMAPATLRAALTLLKPKDAGKAPVTDEAIANLKKNLATKPVRGTDFIKIIAQAETKEEAVQLSNAVATAYVKRRKEAETAVTKRALAALDEELKAQTDVVKEQRQYFSAFVRAKGVLDNQAKEDYENARDVYEEARDILRGMKVKQQEARVLLKRPRDPVTIHEKAR